MLLVKIDHGDPCLRHCLLIETGSILSVYDHGGKVDIRKGYLNPKRKFTHI